MDVKITINNENTMNKEDKSNTTNVDFGGVAGDAKVVDTEIHGDQVNAENVDQSQGKVDNTGATIEGGQENTSTNIKAGGNVEFNQAVKDFFEELSHAAPSLEEPMVEQRSIPQAETPVDAVAGSDEATEEPPAPEVLSDDEMSALPELDYTENEDHPQMVYASIKSFEESGETPSKEEQAGLFQRTFSCVKKYATSDTAKALAETAAGAIEVVAGGLPFPANLTVFLLKRVSGKG